MQDQRRDRWDKADIILKPVGGLLTAFAVAALGFFGSRALDRRQAEDSRVRLYTELMSQREASETAIRKEMFNTIYGKFLTPAPAGYDRQVLNVELLSYNFNEAIELSPLFKLLYRQINESQPPRAEEYRLRLEQAAGSIKSHQVAALEEAGGKLDATIDLKELDKNPSGIRVIEGILSLPTQGADELDPVLRTAHFKVDALMVDRTRKEIRVKLEVSTPRKKDSGTKPEESDVVYSVFWISPFDFPMISNTPLPHGKRCAIVMRTFGDQIAQITLVYFAEDWRAARVLDMARTMNRNP